MSNERVTVSLSFGDYMLVLAVWIAVFCCCMQLSRIAAAQERAHPAPVEKEAAK